MVVVILLWGLANLVQWVRPMLAGAYFILAFVPLVSIFPIPPIEKEVTANKARTN
jgi:hypothetical protein